MMHYMRALVPMSDVVLVVDVDVDDRVDVINHDVDVTSCSCTCEADLSCVWGGFPGRRGSMWVPPILASNANIWSAIKLIVQ